MIELRWLEKKQFVAAWPQVAVPARTLQYREVIWNSRTGEFDIVRDWVNVPVVEQEKDA